VSLVREGDNDDDRRGVSAAPPIAASGTREEDERGGLRGVLRRSAVLESRAARRKGDEDTDEMGSLAAAVGNPLVGWFGDGPCWAIELQVC
jgi:hypothetical protein